ncbi:hypothetical protein, partial [Raoultella sp. T31]|uniref:hypothetical protein n=1 Tax=Raoultella sp. T31 TaxID=2054594 RepID=UPI00197DA0C4
MALRLPGLQGIVVARVRRKPRPGMFPGGAALTGATGYCGSPGKAQAATRDAPPVALRLPGLQGIVVARV